MVAPKESITKNNTPLHFSVGALIKRDGKYLLIDRTKLPLGYAGIAGHIDEGENPIDALRREIDEESGLKVANANLLFEEELDWNYCSRGINSHYWYLFDCEVVGEIKVKSSEAKSMRWYNTQEIKNLNLEPVWKYWFEKLNII